MCSSYATTEKRSSSRRQRMPCRTASRACAILSPPIEPDRSRTNARLTGRRPGRFGASGAWISAHRKRRLLAPARISWRSARTVNFTFPPGSRRSTRVQLTARACRGRSTSLPRGHAPHQRPRSIRTPFIRNSAPQQNLWVKSGSGEALVPTAPVNSGSLHPEPVGRPLARGHGRISASISTRRFRRRAALFFKYPLTRSGSSFARRR